MLKISLSTVYKMRYIMLRKISLVTPLSEKSRMLKSTHSRGVICFPYHQHEFQGQLIIANVSNGHHYLTRGQTSLEFDGLVISVSVDRAMV